MSLTLVARIREHRDRPAVVAPEGVYSYRDLLSTSAAAATRLLGGRNDLDGARICLLVPPGWAWVAAHFAIWRAGGISVPMGVTHPPAALTHVLDDAEPEAVVVDPDLMERVAPAAKQRSIAVLQTPTLLSPGPAGALPDPAPERRALMLYTSGTTGRPKGVVTTHANVDAQVRALVEAWAWSGDDHILLTLPLHHVHGIVNILLCALWSGAVCQILPTFDAGEVWERWARSDVTLYMAVPTLYRRLIDAWERADAETHVRWSAAACGLRLMVSGSAALPVDTLRRWEEITGHRLLERYGMTEIGMGLSNPLEGERRPGHVGQPLPEVELRLVDEAGHTVPPGTPGQIQVRGPGVFLEYWRRPGATAEAFAPGGWFRTGDRAVLEGDTYRILGRESVDILKTGGEKISALEIEDVMRAHPAVSDCAVVGTPDPEWGQRVCAAVVAAEGSCEPDALRSFVAERLAPCKVPKDILLVGELPRNAMGKVVKSAVAELFKAGAGGLPE